MTRIGLALSGGGFRATCFGLGCLRALNDRGVLNQVSVISGVSGGALLASLYAYGPESFNEFDDGVVELLRANLQLAVLKRAVRPDFALRNLYSAAGAATNGRRGGITLRRSNRTDALRSILEQRFFDDRTMSDVTHAGLDTVITATDLRSGNAMRFGSAFSSCSAYGTVVGPVAVAEAVAASAAFPFVLPAVERQYAFQRKPESDVTEQTLYMTDGGVYDNLGLSVLEPGRSKAFTPHVYNPDYIIACDAGRGALQVKNPHFLAFRLKRSADITYKKLQDSTRGHLYDAQKAGLVRGFVYSYLGMKDRNLPVPLADLVPLSEVQGYRTDFGAMTEDKINRIALRGEQLTRTLLTHYCPEL